MRSHRRRSSTKQQASSSGARKLMPGHPGPRMNLALTLEQAGRTDEAIQTYKTALEVFPGHVPTEQALARYVRSAATPEELDDLLSSIARQGARPRGGSGRGEWETDGDRRDATLPPQIEPHGVPVHLELPLATSDEILCCEHKYPGHDC